LKARFQKFRLIIVGGECPAEGFELDPEIIRLRNIALKIGVADHIHFAGRQDRDQLKYYYSAADIFITTPLYEPFGITPIEAMASGVPVIGSCVGGIKYTVVDGKTGFLVPPGRPDILAQKTAQLLADPQLQSTMAENGLKRVRELFTWKRVC